MARIRLLLIAALFALPVDAGEPPHAVSLYVFWGAGCPHCEDQKPFLEQLAAGHPTLVVHSMEVWQDSTHHALFDTLARAHGIPAGSVPTVFVGSRVWIGDSEAIRMDIAQTVARCSREPCPDPVQRALSLPHEPTPVSREPGSRSVSLPVLGSLDLNVQPLILSTVLIALVDGVNPCSLWVLTVLLALVIHSGSRQRILAVGLTFLATTAAVYGLFMVGLFGVLGFLAYLGWVQTLVALFALAFAAVNIKDYFRFREGLSFTIAERHKPGLYRSIRGLMAPGRSLAALVGATFLMALGIALVELPCTAGFPVIWSGLVAEREPGFAAFAALLAIYLAVYLADELAIFAAAALTLRIGRIQETHGRLLKLLGGMIMLALALTLLLAPEILNRTTHAALVFLAAVAVTLAVLLVDRRLLPRLRARDGS
jgi:cytochrome c biogenesis protein CcdA